MKKLSLILTSLLMTVVLLTACAGGESTKTPKTADVADKVVAAAEFTELIDLTDANIERRYYGIDLEKIEEYTVRVCSSGALADEVAVFKMKDKQDVEDMLNVVKERKQELYDAFVDYVPEEVGKINDAVINSKGNYVYFIVTDDRSDAKEAVEACF